MIDFSNNVNFLGPPDTIIDSLKKRTGLYENYPDHHHQQAKEAIAKQFSINPESIGIANGSTELFSVTPKLTVSDAIGISPSFWEYSYFFKKNHPLRTYEKISLQEHNNFLITKQHFIHKIKKSSAGICYITNPNNPTTTLFDREDLIDIIESFPDKLFIVDETYLPFMQRPYDQELSLFSLAKDKLNLIVVSSMSKIFCLPGLRVGYCCSHPDNINKLYKYILPYSVNPISLSIISDLTQQSSFIIHTQQQYEKNRAYFINELESVFGDFISIYNSGTAFLLIKFSSAIHRGSMDSYLFKNNIKIRSGVEFDGLGSNWMRLSIRHIDEIDYFIKKIREYMN